MTIHPGVDTVEGNHHFLPKVAGFKLRLIVIATALIKFPRTASQSK
jgi:hypothetical protein